MILSVARASHIYNFELWNIRYFEMTFDPDHSLPLTDCAELAVTCKNRECSVRSYGIQILGITVYSVQVSLKTYNKHELCPRPEKKFVFVDVLLIYLFVLI